MATHQCKPLPGESQEGFTEEVPHAQGLEGGEHSSRLSGQCYNTRKAEQTYWA